MELEAGGAGDRERCCFEPQSYVVVDAALIDMYPLFLQDNSSLESRCPDDLVAARLLVLTTGAYFSC
jgi:hypothetical protein